MMYEEADKAIRIMNRANLKAFGRLKLAKWDSLNVIRTLKELYNHSESLAKKQYLRVARQSCMEALREVKANPSDADDIITEMWVLGLLNDVDPVTLYSFRQEKLRKEQRLAEALSVTNNRDAEIDRALRLWTLQVGQYADNSVFYARIEAFREAGIEHVMWMTEHDDRVCPDCDALDGQIFPIDDVPPPQHFNCRCWLEPISD